MEGHLEAETAGAGEPASPEPGEWAAAPDPSASPCRLVEEFMLLANMAVAHKIHRAFPERALLRRHPPPQTKMLSDLEEFCDQMGLPMDFSSAGAIDVSARSPGGAGRGSVRGRGGGSGGWRYRSLCVPPQSVPLQLELPCKREGRPWEKASKSLRP